MKKIIASILTLSAITLMAETPPLELWQELCVYFSPSGDLGPHDISEFARFHNASSEQMTEALERIVRDGLTDLEEKKKKEAGEANAYKGLRSTRLMGAISALRDFHGTNTVALLQECILTDDGNTGVGGMYSYVDIAGTNAIPFIRDAIGQGRVNERSRQLFYSNVQMQLDRAKREAKGDDIEKYSTIALALAQVEPRPDNVRTLDGMLSANVEGYADSPDRANILARINQLKSPPQLQQPAE